MGVVGAESKSDGGRPLLIKSEMGDRVGMTKRNDGVGSKAGAAVKMTVRRRGLSLLISSMQVSKP